MGNHKKYKSNNAKDQSKKIYLRSFRDWKITSWYATVFSIKTGSFILIDLASNNKSADFAVYQQLIKKLLYFAYKIMIDISFLVGLLS